jgi:hypothetical protein
MEETSRHSVLQLSCLKTRHSLHLRLQESVPELKSIEYDVRVSMLKTDGEQCREAVFPSPSLPCIYQLWHWEFDEREWKSCISDDDVITLRLAVTESPQPSQG